MEASEIPGFHPDEELEEKLEENPGDLSDDTFLRLQRYKSRKLQAKRDAGMSEDSPSWSMLKPGDGLSVEDSSTQEASEAQPPSKSETSKPVERDGPGEGAIKGSNAEQSGDITQYYSRLKETIPRESSPQEDQPTETSSQKPPESDSSPGSSSDRQSPDEPSEPSGPEERGGAGFSGRSAAARESSPMARPWTEWVRELEEKVFRKQEEIARLREEIGRLKERVREE